MHAILPTCHYTVRVGDVADAVPLDTFSKATKRVVGWNGEWLGGWIVRVTVRGQELGMDFGCGIWLRVERVRSAHASPVSMSSESANSCCRCVRGLLL